jgi:hypothetical protein
VRRLVLVRLAQEQGVAQLWAGHLAQVKAVAQPLAAHLRRSWGQRVRHLAEAELSVGHLRLGEEGLLAGHLRPEAVGSWVVRLPRPAERARRFSARVAVGLWEVGQRQALGSLPDRVGLA